MSAVVNNTTMKEDVVPQPLASKLKKLRQKMLERTEKAVKGIYDHYGKTFSQL